MIVHHTCAGSDFKAGLHAVNLKVWRVECITAGLPQAHLEAWPASSVRTALGAAGFVGIAAPECTILLEKADGRACSRIVCAALVLQATE